MFRSQYTYAIRSYALLSFEIVVLVGAVPFFRRNSRFKPPVIHRQWLAILVSALVPVVLRLALLPWWPVPVPYVTDEFSYLLAADTYASGHVTNPQHPLWKHFDSLNILVRPAYVSKYPPGQGLILAVGQVLFRNPWAGVCLGIAFMCGAIYWMLEAYLGRRWALTGALLAGLHFGLPGYWMNSFWGGGLAAAAGALALGAAIRQRGLSVGVGIVLLSLTRPFEGAIFCLPLLFLMKRRTILWAAPVVCLGLAGLAYQNWRVMGNPLNLPYLEAARQSQAAPAFIWNNIRKDILYLDPFLELNYGKYEVEFVTAPFLPRMETKYLHIWLFFFGPALTLPFLLRPRLWQDRRLRRLWPFLATAAVTVFVETAYFPHYIAPYTAVFLVFIIQAFRHVNAARAGWGAMIPEVVCITVAAATFLAVTQKRADTLSSPPSWCCMETRPWSRFQVIAKLEKEPRPQLLIVRYALHQPLPAWVYNPANIDASKIVFARDYGPCGNQELLHYYANRQKWLLEVDGFDYRLTPYPQNQSCVG